MSDIDIKVLLQEMYNEAEAARLKAFHSGDGEEEHYYLSQLGAFRGVALKFGFELDD
jgi:hypothetical protein